MKDDLTKYVNRRKVNTVAAKLAEFKRNYRKAPSFTAAELWKAQMREHPRSVFMPIYEVYQWCDEPTIAAVRLLRYQQIAMALQYGSVVFYRIEDTDYRGFRFGTKSHEYTSMYGYVDRPARVKLSDDERLVLDSTGLK